MQNSRSLKEAFDFLLISVTTAEVWLNNRLSRQRFRQNLTMYEIISWISILLSCMDAISRKVLCAWTKITLMKVEHANINTLEPLTHTQSFENQQEVR